MHTLIQLHIHYNMVYARKLYLITSTNLCPETIIEAKLCLRAYSHLKEVSLLMIINLETTMSRLSYSLITRVIRIGSDNCIPYE